MFIAYVGYLGIRRPIFLLVGGLFATYSVVHFRPKLLTALLIAIPVFLLFSTFSQYRQIISAEGPVATIEFIRDNASIDWLDVSNSELGAPFRTLYDELPNVDREGHLYGRSYLIAPLYMLPSSINHGATSLSIDYTARYFDPRFIMIGGNMGYFPVTEAYYNFGLPGVVLMFALMAALLGHVNNRFFERWRGSPLAVAFFAVMIPWVAFFMRLDFASFAKSFLYSQFLCFPALYFMAQLFAFEGHRKVNNRSTGQTYQGQLAVRSRLAEHLADRREAGR
jgi:oligosaccharide repeat unit polymerase